MILLPVIIIGILLEIVGGFLILSGNKTVKHPDGKVEHVPNVLLGIISGIAGLVLWATPLAMMLTGKI